ncbi:MAG: hypothetical protein AAFP97_00465 [Pseudomonadota bacterium]
MDHLMRGLFLLALMWACFVSPALSQSDVETQAQQSYIRVSAAQQLDDRCPTLAYHERVSLDRNKAWVGMGIVNNYSSITPRSLSRWDYDAKIQSDSVACDMAGQALQPFRLEGYLSTVAFMQQGLELLQSQSSALDRHVLERFVSVLRQAFPGQEQGQPTVQQLVSQQISNRPAQPGIAAENALDIAEKGAVTIIANREGVDIRWNATLQTWDMFDPNTNAFRGHKMASPRIMPLVSVPPQGTKDDPQYILSSVAVMPILTEDRLRLLLMGVDGEELLDDVIAVAQEHKTFSTETFRGFVSTTCPTSHCIDFTPAQTEGIKAGSLDGHAFSMAFYRPHDEVLFLFPELIYENASVDSQAPFSLQMLFKDE